MKSHEVRERFLSFFESHGHHRVASSSLIPAEDPTLLFANAGMNQFKDVFLGKEKRAYSRACSSQKCVRAGGKHNDLDNVGYTARHHTFFEMLGNFSFGDYFKKEAIELAWRFLVDELSVPQERLYVTVYQDDDEAFGLWHDHMGLDASRIFRFGEKDNFWSMGDTGPCGPCSEIFYDFGATVPGSEDPFTGIEEGSDRYVEVWNLVFMQYDRQADGKMVPLPNPSIDTGMGLERICAVAQGVYSNYETDLFTDLMAPIQDLLGVDDEARKSPAMRVIADHLRSMSFLMADGVVPSNEGRGYVLRRIMRRAMRYGKQLGRTEPFLAQLVGVVAQKMADQYPELTRELPQIKTLTEVEERQFDTTLSKGMPVFNKYVKQLKDQQVTEMPGQVLFFLYGTHGFPVDLMADMARDEGMTLDMAGFKALMEEDAKQGAGGQGFAARAVHPKVAELAARGGTRQHCYHGLEAKGNVLLMLSDGDEPKETLSRDQKGTLILDETAFYGESGGQVGDVGVIEGPHGAFQVENTTRVNDVVLHAGRVVKGEIRHGDACATRVDGANRDRIRKNHTATHLLHKALRDVVGLHVRQAGSLVDPDKLRFDFSHFSALTPESVRQIEEQVNRAVLRNLTVNTEVMDLNAARERGAMALFGEKYAEQVRVVCVGDDSMELCGGTHVRATGEIGCFKVVGERALASGIRRITALTGENALHAFQEMDDLLARLRSRFSIHKDNLLESIERMIEERKQLEKQVEALKLALAKGGSSSLEVTEEVRGFKVLCKRVKDVDGGQLRQLADELLDRVKHGVVLLGADLGDKAQLVVKVSPDLDGVHAGQIIKVMAQAVGGSGGGKPAFAMAGGKQPEHLELALRKGLDHLRGEPT